jgi:hypothetical protein
LKRVHCKNEKQGGDGVALPKASLMLYWPEFSR